MKLRRQGRKQGGSRAIQVAVRHRIMTWLTVCMFLAAAMLVALAVAQDGAVMPESEFPISNLRVENTFDRVSVEQVADVVAPFAAKGFFETDVAAINQALVDLPWVRAAAVRRVWPDTLHVTLVEEKAVAKWGERGLLNPDGDVFYPEMGEQVTGLPVLEGPPRTSHQVMTQYRRLSAHLDPLGLTIARLSMDARRAWELTLGDGVKLILGRKDAERQLSRFARFYPELIDENPAGIAVVDLRYTNGFAVTRHDSDAEQAGAGNKTGDAV